MKKNKQQDSNGHDDPVLVTEQVDRILAHQSFADCVRSQQFLRYVVGETLEGRAARIKGVSIAYDVFQLEDPEQAQTSTVVRVEAGPPAATAGTVLRNRWPNRFLPGPDK